MSALAFTQDVIAEYIREDLRELENPMRRDQGRILEELRYLFRSYGQKYKKIQDWSPSASLQGREDAPGEQ